MSSSAINTQVAQLKIGNVQNQADNSAVYSGGIWSLKNSTALTSVTITDAGRVGIGTTSPATKLEVLSASSTNIIQSTTTGTTASDSAQMVCSNGTVSLQMYAYSSAGEAVVGSASNHPLVFRTNSVERMRIDASGRLLVGTTGTIASSGAVIQGSNTGAPALALNRSNDGGIVYFYRGGAGPVGEIAVTASNTAYNTSGSDYRLKEQIQNLSGGLDKIKALRPVSFMWKQSQKQDIGFIAHEVQSVIPECITGQKDAVDDEGNPVYQSIFPAPAQMIANLVAAIQELSTKNDALEARLAALEAKP